MPFSNPIVGGTALVRPAINSPNFQTGVQGWSVNADGSAEFNSATVRGQVIVGASPNAIELFQPPNVPIELVNFYAARSESLTAVQLFRDTTGRYEYFGNLSGGALVIGAVDNVGNVQEMIFTWHQSPNASFAFGEASPVDLYVSNQGGGTTFETDVPLNFSTGGVPETWHGITLQNGWTNLGSPDVFAKYRMVPSPANTVQIVGTIAAGTKTDGTTIFTLPVGYRPNSFHIFPITANGLDTTVVAQLQIGTAGQAFISGVSAAGITHISFGCILLALDA